MVLKTSYFDPKHLARYFEVDFDSNELFSHIFQRSAFKLQKEQNHLLRKNFGSPHTRNQSTYSRIAFQTMYALKIYTEP